MCQRKGAIQSNSSDLLISERFSWKNGDREGARQLVLVSHHCFLYVEDLLQQLSKVCMVFSGISRKC